MCAASGLSLGIFAFVPGSLLVAWASPWRLAHLSCSRHWQFSLLGMHTLSVLLLGSVVAAISCQPPCWVLRSLHLLPFGLLLSFWCLVLPRLASFWAWTPLSAGWCCLAPLDIPSFVLHAPLASLDAGGLLEIRSRLDLLLGDPCS